MDVAEPGRGIAPGLTVPILRVLSRRSTPVTAAQLTRLTTEGTEAGVRRAVERLAAHGVCTREEIAGRVTYALNHDHVLYRAVRELLRADTELTRRLRATLAEWRPAPVSAVLFGSAARLDGDIDSDIDLLLVRPVITTDRARQTWARQVHDLRRDVTSWTGNGVQIIDRSARSVAVLMRRDTPLFGNIRDDGVLLHGVPFGDVVWKTA